MTTSTQKILSEMSKLKQVRADMAAENPVNPFANPPSIPTRNSSPQKSLEMSEVLNNCLRSEKGPGKLPR